MLNLMACSIKLLQSLELNGANAYGQAKPRFKNAVVVSNGLWKLHQKFPSEQSIVTAQERLLSYLAHHSAAT